jgi:N-acetylglutamate synthase-like GNAT family acetyltransferase
LSDAAKIRPARRGDQQAIAELLRQLGYADAGDSHTQLWVLNHPEIFVFVATDHLDKAIGFISVSLHPQLRLRGRIATIDELVVAEAWRKKGVGSRLLATAVSRAKELQAKRIELLTAPDRAAAGREFFKKNGFGEADTAVMRLAELEKK